VGQSDIIQTSSEKGAVPAGMLLECLFVTPTVDSMVIIGVRSCHLAGVTRGRPSWLHLYIGHWPPCFWEVAGFHGNWSVSNRMLKVRPPPYGKQTSNCLLLRADHVTAVNVFFFIGLHQPARGQVSSYI
jgi:hypothetical protein